MQIQDAKKSSKNRHLGTITQLCRAISLQLRYALTIGKKNLLSSNISFTCSHNMVNFSPLAAEIGPVVWGTPANFNGFCVLAALLHGTPVLGISQTLRCWTEGATYLWQGGHHVGRPHSSMYLWKYVYNQKCQVRGNEAVVSRLLCSLVAVWRCWSIHGPQLSP